MSRSRLFRYPMIAEAGIALLRAEWMIRCRPFSDTATQLSKPIGGAALDLPTLNSSTPDSLTPDSLRMAQDVRAALLSLGRRIPWNQTCLVSAVAAHSMLAKRNVNATLILSVMPGGSATVNAHAWLEAAGIVVTGRNEMEKFIPIYKFDNRPKFDSPPRFDNRPTRPMESVPACLP